MNVVKFLSPKRKQESKKTRTLDRFLGRVLVFLFSYFLVFFYEFPPQTNLYDRRSSKPKPVPAPSQPNPNSASESPAVAERLAEYQRDSPVPLR